MTDGAADYCADQVQRFDRDRYLLTLTAPADARPHLFALFAFNLEIAKTADVVSEPMLGRIRLQWWREALDEIFAGAPRRHEVVEALAAAHADRPLDRALLERIIEAREVDLETESIATERALEDYAASTSGALQSLAVSILGGDEDHNVAATHAGSAYALARLLRAVPYHAARNRVFLPQELLRRRGLTRDDLAMPRRPADLAEVIAIVADSAQNHIERARAARAPGAERVLSALLPAVLADFDLALLRSRRHDVFAPDPPSEAWRRPLVLSWRRLRGRY